MSDNQQWKGYTFDELRMMRLVNLTRLEMEKAKLAHVTKSVTDKTQWLGNKPILKKITGALDYVDYAMIAYSVGRRLIKIFRHKKKH